MSILRTSKFFKYFISFKRSIVVNKTREINWALFNEGLSIGTPRFLRYAAITRDPSLEKYVQKLDQDVRRTGRINRKELDYALNGLKNLKHATGTQSLMIIRCCGNLIPEESPEVRTDIVKKIWATFESMGVPLDISHYNALLRVYIENEYKFSPTDFLSELQSKGVEPNRVTFQRLISTYCQRGDIEGATRILEYMKEKQMPVNENVFSSLINGHFQAGDVESAVGILNVMKQANIKPSNETYTVIMCGHAKTGDIAAIKDILAQCEKEEVDISDKDVLEVMYSLAVHNHTNLIDQLIENLRKTPGYNQDAKNTILRLIVQGQDEAAFKILRTMTPISTPDGDPVPVGNFFIKHLVKCKRPKETIISFCEELKNSGQNEYALAVATEASLLNETPDLSRHLLSVLSQDQPVCHHYYWPVLVQYGKNRNLQGIHETLIQMAQEVGSPISGDTVRDYVAPYVPEGEPGIYEMRKGGISLASAAAAMVCHLLEKSNIDAAVKIALNFNANYNSPNICRIAANAFVRTNELKPFITLVRVFVRSSNEETEKDHLPAADRIILDVAHALKRQGKLGTICEVLKEYFEAGIGISPETAEAIQSLFSGDQLTTEISTLLTKLTSPDLVPKDLERPQITRRPAIHLLNDESSILAGIKVAESKGENPLGLKRQLFSYYCLNKEVEKAEQLFKELEKEGFEFVTGSLVHLMDMYINCENLPRALEVYDMIYKNMDSSSKQTVQIDISKIVRIAGLMIKENKFEDALKLLSKHKLESESQRGFNTNAVGWRLLNSIAERKEPELLKSTFDALVENNIIEPNNVTLGPLIKVHILRDDIESAMAQFEECCQKYRATPWKNEIACKLILKEDPVSLQKLTDLSTDIHGEINSLYDLVLSFIECGRIRQARKILETPGLRLRNLRINSACERYGNEGKVNYLENLIEATKDLNHIDRADIYYHLLLTYCKVDDVDKALGLWTQMQDEDVQPSDEFLVKLGDILSKHNRPIPFAIPNIRVEQDVVGKTVSTASSQIKQFRKTINSRNVDETLNMLSKFNQEELSNGDRSKVINLLINNGRIGEASKLLMDWFERGLQPNLRTISNVVNALAKIGDVDTLTEIGRVIDKGIKRFTSFSNRYAHCMVEAGRVNDLLSELEKGIKSAKTEKDLEILQEEFPRGGILSVLSNAPDSTSKIEEIAMLYAEKGIMDPYNALWAFYFSGGNFEKANEFWSKLNNKERIMFQPILKQVRSEKNIALCWDLVNLLKASSVSSEQLGPVYSCLIDVENNSGNLPECERILDEALKDCSINNISRGVLLRLKRSLEAAGQPFRYTLPPRISTRREREDASSDSDSDSDLEDAHKPSVRV